MSHGRWRAHVRGARRWVMRRQCGARHPRGVCGRGRRGEEKCGGGGEAKRGGESIYALSRVISADLGRPTRGVAAPEPAEAREPSATDSCTRAVSPSSPEAGAGGRGRCRGREGGWRGREGGGEGAHRLLSVRRGRSSHPGSERRRRSGGRAARGAARAPAQRARSGVARRARARRRRARALRGGKQAGSRRGAWWRRWTRARVAARPGSRAGSRPPRPRAGRRSTARPPGTLASAPPFRPAAGRARGTRRRTTRRSRSGCRGPSAAPHRCPAAQSPCQVEAGRAEGR